MMCASTDLLRQLLRRQLQAREERPRRELVRVRAIGRVLRLRRRRARQRRPLLLGRRLGIGMRLAVCPQHARAIGSKRTVIESRWVSTTAGIRG
jgi:hypothetical protein